jgi:2,5-dihydroxypyridine 5,6-dioxygenase
VQAHETAAIVSETQSRAIHGQLAELALLRLGARTFHVVVPTPRQPHPVPIRSTGASQALQGIGPAVEALRGSDVVVDCTVEGLLHAPELPRILSGSARVLMISNEHPEALERLLPSLALREVVNRARARLESSRRMHVTSKAGTDLHIDLAQAPVRGASGIADAPGQVAYWPAGLVACFPRSNCVNGTLVLDRGDVNLTFKRYLESAVRLTIEKDYVVDLSGDGLDAELMRDYLAAWNEREAYATSHIGWGLNPAARWDALTMYDKADTNGTELRACAGNFLYSTGSNQYAGRFTAGHFDLPVRGCTIRLDGELVVDAGRLLEPAPRPLERAGS